MNEQLSFFGEIGMDETPQIPFEEQKKGTVGWVIMPTAAYTVENGFDRNMIGVETRKVRLWKDSSEDRIGRTQYAETIDLRGCGWCADPRPLYRTRPSWKECVEYIRKTRRREPQDFEVVYTRSNWEGSYDICSWEEGARP